MESMFRYIVSKTSAPGFDEMELTLVEATNAKNTLTRKHGFSPVQHVSGRDIRLPASIGDGEHGLAAHSRAEGEGGYRHRLTLRMAVCMAWVGLDNSSRLRRSILAKALKHRGPW